MHQRRERTLVRKLQIFSVLDDTYVFRSVNAKNLTNPTKITRECGGAGAHVGASVR